MNETTTKTTTKLAVIKMKTILEGKDLLEAVHSDICTPKVDVLSHEEIEEVEIIVKENFPLERQVHVSKFVKTFDKVLYGRELLCTKMYRGGTMKDQFVFTRINGRLADTQPAEIHQIIEVDVRFGSDNPIAMVFLKLCLFEEHPKKNLYGEMCPMKLCSTIVKEFIFVPINFILRKACFTKAKAYYQDYVVSNCRQSRVRASDVVYFVI
eukprot:Seg4681.1 transcript_id=Seg4681.1/GoldUCD/mRNA.D3Y31 product="hypothetical protein" protein_id=Seg4681.1/GoldUCD/D3Y31